MPGERGPSELMGVRVLVVEDHWHLAKILKALLEAMGLDVIGPVATVAEARRLVAEQKPALAVVDITEHGCAEDPAVVDINLKGELTYPLIDQLHTQDVRVVVVTGYAVLPQATEKVGAILQKPFSEADLRATLRRAVLN